MILLPVATAPVRYPLHCYRWSLQLPRYAAECRSSDGDQRTIFVCWVIQETYLKDVAQIADVPKGLQYCVGILCTPGGASGQIVTLQLLDLIFLKDNGTEED
jgi:hypothetical protein